MTLVGNKIGGVMSRDLKIRIGERIRIYRDSPSLQVTYVDLAHILEDFLELLEIKEVNGFKGEHDSHVQK